jgi:hypothetical protein
MHARPSICCSIAAYLLVASQCPGELCVLDLQQRPPWCVVGSVLDGCDHCAWLNSAAGCVASATLCSVVRRHLSNVTLAFDSVTRAGIQLGIAH